MAAHTAIADMFDATRWGEQFGRDEIEIIAGYLSLHAFGRGQHIFREKDRHDFLAFIVEGRVNIVKDRPGSCEEAITTLFPRTHFGEMAFVDGGPRSASAVAADDVTLLVLSRSRFDDIMAEHPRVALKMLTLIARLLSRRLRQTTGRLARRGSDETSACF